MEQEFRTEVNEDSGEAGVSLGGAVADLVENVIANALKIAEDVANDSARVARSAREFIRNLQDA
jgi:hypothetical protein